MLLVKGYCGSKGLSSRISQKDPKRERKTRAERNGTSAKGGTSKGLDTTYISYSLFRQGQTVAEIAAGRGLSANTIESHLGQYIFTGAIEINELVNDEKKLKIQDAVESYGADKLSPLKEVLGDDYSYGEIKATMAWMRKEKII